MERSYEDQLVELEAKDPAKFRQVSERREKAENARTQQRRAASRPYVSKRNAADMDPIYRALAYLTGLRIAAEQQIESWWDDLRVRTVSARPWAK